MPEDEVTEHGATEQPVVPQGQGDKGKGGKDETVTLSKSEVEALRRDRDEARQSERYWANVARSGGKQAEEVQETADEDLDSKQFVDENANDGLDGDTPEKLVDEFAAKGVAALKTRGFVTAADAQKMAVEIATKVTRELISRERQKITSDTQIMTEFPELRDQGSDLFKKTAEFYQAAVAMDPAAKKTPAALFLAARAARASLGNGAADRRPRGDDDPEHEDDRRRRADSQDGGKTRGRGEVADDDMLGDEARQVIKQMGISEAEFRESRKQTAGARPSTRRR